MGNRGFLIVLTVCLLLPSQPALTSETISVALTSKAFQYTILPIAQDRGYMKEEGFAHQADQQLSKSGWRP